jgi:hypothetical protein
MVKNKRRGEQDEFPTQKVQHGHDQGQMWDGFSQKSDDCHYWQEGHG